MKIQLGLFMAALIGISAAGQVSLAQYPGQLPPQHAAPVYGPMATMPMGPYAIAPAQFYGAPGGMAPASMYAPAVLPASLGEPDGGSCANGKCGGKSGKCESCCDQICLSGGYDGHMAFYGDFLYLRARDAEVAYAVPFDGPIVPGRNTVQVGPVGVADMDFQPGFRVGVDYILNECTKVSTVYTMYEAGTSDQVITQAPLVVRANVGHPGTNVAGQTFLQADAQYDISYDLLDFDMHRLLSYSSDHQLAYVLGVRFAQLEQELQTDFAGNSTMSVDTDIDFYGVGLRGGLEWERYIGCQWKFYAKGYGSLIPGEFRADFDQRQSFDPRVIDTGWKGGRIVTMWDLELGTGWTSKCGYYSFDAGYIFSAWTNVVQTDEWIRGVHENSFIDMDDTMTFDGLVTRFTARY